MGGEGRAINNVMIERFRRTRNDRENLPQGPIKTHRILYRRRVLSRFAGIIPQNSA